MLSRKHHSIILKEIDVLSFVSTSTKVQHIVCRRDDQINEKRERQALCESSADSRYLKRCFKERLSNILRKEVSFKTLSTRAMNILRMY